MKIVLLTCFTSLLFFAGCGSRSNNTAAEPMVSIQVIDRNGFAETISGKDRLVRYKNTDFLAPQPYQKVMRVFGKDKEGLSSSKITSYHPNGHIWQYLEVVNGRAHGSYREWHANGALKLSFSVIEGNADLSDSATTTWVFEGKNSIWDEDGDLVAEIFYEKGSLHGDSLYYHKSGSLKKKLPYQSDMLQGDALVFSPQGDLTAKTPFVNDIPEGEAFVMSYKKKTLAEETFDGGLLLKGRYFHPDTSKPLSSIEDGFGKRAEFKKDRLQRLVEYKKGMPEGIVEIFREDGAIISSYEQKDGKKHGEERIYYSERPDLLKMNLEWQEDTLQGTIRTWFLSGIQESEKRMFQNKRNGPLLAWYENGDLMLQEDYENDVLSQGTYYKKGSKDPVSRIINGKGTATLYTEEGFFLKKISYDKGIPEIGND